MIKKVFALFIFCMFLCVPATFAENPEVKKQAVASAQEWLGLVDDGQYAKSWQEAATYFQKAVPQQQWAQTLKAVRAPLGKVLSRSLKGATYKASLPGAPDGEYVVIQFDTSFANKKNAVETVTPMMDVDKKWRVSGYYIK